jgi:hypothetical protein
MPTNNSLRRHALSGGRSSIVFEIEIVADLAEVDEKFWSMRTLMDTGLARLDAVGVARAVATRGFWFSIHTIAVGLGANFSAAVYMRGGRR